MDTKLIVFDFDGTIADTQEAVIAITNRLAPEFGFPPLKFSPFKWGRYCLLSTVNSKRNYSTISCLLVANSFFNETG